ncbi:Uncharacterized protein OBRU01_16564 [Operophtera brumata]|uniref:Uncharacterized protein n=1 Tax=Operophtera brumata TaxID=104452 RepID=A0A0L7KV23_OPEBR|nr:Uncharacterized protein OBRU01_16564 [Operophtera brumata]
MSTKVLLQDKGVPLYNRQTDCDSFRDIVDETLKLKVSLKSSGDVVNATMQFTNTIQKACWRCTPQKSEYGMRLKNVPWEIRKRIQEKRRLRRVWHTRCRGRKYAKSLGITNCHQSHKLLTLESNEE